MTCPTCRARSSSTPTRGVSRGAALHSALYVVGANHNYFNTEWTPGQAEAPASDDFWYAPTTPCARRGHATRLTATSSRPWAPPTSRRPHGCSSAGDQRVLPLLDGSGRPGALGRPGARAQPRRRWRPRTPFVVPAGATAASGSAKVCSQITQDAAARCLPEPSPAGLSPHFVGLRGARSSPNACGVAEVVRGGQSSRGAPRAARVVERLPRARTAPRRSVERPGDPSSASP